MTTLRDKLAEEDVLDKKSLADLQAKLDKRSLDSQVLVPILDVDVEQIKAVVAENQVYNLAAEYL